MKTIILYWKNNLSSVFIQMSIEQPDFLNDDKTTGDQKSLVLAWSLTVGVITLIFIMVILMMRRDEQKDKRKLYNFDLAPR